MAAEQSAWGNSRSLPGFFPETTITVGALWKRWYPSLPASFLTHSIGELAIRRIVFSLISSIFALSWITRKCQG